MEMLQIDRAKLMDEPLLYRELQGVCTLCPNRQECSLAPPCRRLVRHPQVRRVVAVLPKLRNADNDRSAAKLRKNASIHSRDGV
jgi:hypothetical protein